MRPGTSIDDQRGRPWHLLICGPIAHPGYVQSTHVAGNLLMMDSFDCNRTICKTIERWGHLFESIQFVTWTNQADLIGDDLKAKGIDIQILDDPGQEASGDNRIRVMVATIAGTECISDPKAFAVRMRSDQYFDLEKFILNHEQNDRLIRRNQRKIGAQLPHISGLCFWLDKPYALRNYAYAGTVEDLKSFAEAQVLYRHASALSQHNWPEGDTIRKHLYSLRNQLEPYGFRSEHCFPALPKSIKDWTAEGNRPMKLPVETLRLWKFALSNIYSVASSEVQDSMLWKGHPYPPSKITVDGMRFCKKWRQCIRRDLKPILDYCSQELTTIPPRPWSDLLWTLPGQAEKIQGLPLSKKSKLIAMARELVVRRAL